mmetsp:Transcript_6102/g.7313  ORF Transcript_6102/g.7313 Transcript_6102/m.7313 type:complete len:158 (-) Transcript_6102:98-571(-)
MRIQSLTQSTSLIKSTPHQFFTTESGDSAIVLVQEDKIARVQKVSLLKTFGFDQGNVKLASGQLLKDISQINSEKGSKKALLLVGSQSIRDFSNETQQSLKSATCVMTDSGFNIEEFVAKIEPLMDSDKDLAGSLARTNFIVVSEEALTSLRSSVLS